ncbi:MAG: hypothetical protein WCG78_06590 [Candidatus Omnitrophota bacterium]
MKPKNHIIASGIVSTGVYIVTHSPVSGVVSFLAGVLIDLDHLIDYYLNYGATYKLGHIYTALDECRLSRVYLFLHSFELLVLFWVAVFLVPLNGICCAIALGFTQHIFLDQYYNPVTPRAYFLSYRYAHKFTKESIIDRSKLPSSLR